MSDLFPTDTILGLGDPERFNQDEQMLELETQPTLPILDPEPAIEVSADMKFEINCKNLFLTYPMTPCDLVLELLVKHLLDELDEQHVHGIYAVKELHSTGEEHVHVLIALKKRKHIRGSHVFDYNGCHCHIQRCEKGLAIAYKYLQKEYVYVRVAPWGVEMVPGIMEKAIYNDHYFLTAMQ